MSATHGQIARLTVEKQPQVFARACRDVVVANDFTMLNRMLPGVAFAVRKVDQEMWELTGVCEDGSTVNWHLG